MSINEPLDSSTHELLLENIASLLGSILKEIKELRKDVGRLPGEMERGD
jgi:hypothetical protein